MIIVVVTKERNKKTGQDEVVVSHGYDSITGKSVVMSGGSPSSVGAVWNPELGEYVLPE